MIFSGLFAKADAKKPAGEISYEELMQAVENKACAVVDVREPHEYSGGHIPGAINRPLSRFDPGSLPSGNPVVLICLTGARSAAALTQARKAGTPNARHYPAGMKGWRANGGGIER